MRFSLQIVLVGMMMVNVLGQSRAQEPATNQSSASLTAHEVAAKMEEKGRERALALHDFEASRVYRLEYRGFGGNKEAEMKVRMTYRAPASKTFSVISSSGSNFIIEHVFNRLLQSEQEALDDQNRQATALTLENYDFALAGYQENADGSHTYVLNVKPRTKNKFLYEGKIWVNGEDFAVTRIEAFPAKNPSFWIKKTQIEHVYTKVGSFWLPSQNRSESQLRLGGRAVLTIDYDYQGINAAASADAPAPAGNAVAQKTGSHAAKKAEPHKHSRQFPASDAALADAINIPK